MGNWNSGKRPTPTAIRVLRGNPSRRRYPVGEPTYAPAAVDADPPPIVRDNPDAAAEWRRVVPLLQASRVLTEADVAVVITLCVQWATWLGAQRHLARDGMVLKRRGDLVINPYAKIARDAFTQCHHVWIELGLTPSSRARLGHVPPARTPPTAPPSSKWSDDL